jgi:hypothetical protein
MIGALPNEALRSTPRVLLAKELGKGQTDTGALFGYRSQEEE